MCRFTWQQTLINQKPFGIELFEWIQKKNATQGQQSALRNYIRKTDGVCRVQCTPTVAVHPGKQKIVQIYRIERNSFRSIFIYISYMLLIYEALNRYRTPQKR